MFVKCDICKYDSGDFDSCEQIAMKVNADGGSMALVKEPGTDKPRGWEIQCPNGHSGDAIHLD
jgi:hypothetical protein